MASLSKQKNTSLNNNAKQLKAMQNSINTIMDFF